MHLNIIQFGIEEAISIRGKKLDHVTILGGFVLFEDY